MLISLFIINNNWLCCKSHYVRGTTCSIWYYSKVISVIYHTVYASMTGNNISITTTIIIIVL